MPLSFPGTEFYGSCGAGWKGYPLGPAVVPPGTARTQAAGAGCQPARRIPSCPTIHAGCSVHETKWHWHAACVWLPLVFSRARTSRPRSPEPPARRHRGGRWQTVSWAAKSSRTRIFRAPLRHAAGVFSRRCRSVREGGRGALPPPRQARLEAASMARSACPRWLRENFWAAELRRK